MGISGKSEHVWVNAPNLNDFINLGAARVFFQQKEEVANVPFDGLEEIEVAKLDDLHFSCNNKTLDMIKIDAEGMELDVVAGGMDLIRKHWPLIYAESQPYFQEGDDRFFVAMRDYGYGCMPVKNLEMHEIVMCIPDAKKEHFDEKLARNFAASGGY